MKFNPIHSTACQHSSIGDTSHQHKTMTCICVRRPHHPITIPHAEVSVVQTAKYSHTWRQEQGEEPVVAVLASLPLLPFVDHYLSRFMSV